MTVALSRDLAYTLRTLRKNPAFALTAIATLALGIGANTAIFTIVRSVLLRPLAYREPDRLVLITSGATTVRLDEMQKSARSYTEIGDYYTHADDLALTGAFTPEVIKQARVSANFLRILRVEPLIGRSFTAEEDSKGGPPVVIISANLWQRRFGADPQIVGRTIDVAGFPKRCAQNRDSSLCMPRRSAHAFVVPLGLLHPESGFIGLVELVLHQDGTDKGGIRERKILSSVSLCIDCHRIRTERVAPEPRRCWRAEQHFIIQAGWDSTECHVQALARSRNSPATGCRVLRKLRQ